MRVSRPIPPIACLVLAGVLALGCTRTGPPAPVVYGDARSEAEANAGGVQAAPAPSRKPEGVADTTRTETPRQVVRANLGEPTGRAGVHTVERGDTVHGIARRYRVPLRAVIDANGLEPPYRLSLGQRLRIPVPRRHVVERGDTLYDISRQYGVDMHALARINDLGPPYTIRPKQVLIVPGSGDGDARSKTRVAAARSGGTEESDGDGAASRREPDTAEGADGEDSARPQAVQASLSPPKEIPKPPPRAANRFGWPVRGDIAASFGPQADGLHNDGVNILADRGTAVRAAENGVVAYVGNELRGFGNLLLIKHADGWITAYAHADRILVRRGQTVERGQPVARVGSTGGVARPQLHFEVRRGSRAVDPTKVLEGRRSARAAG